MHAFANTDRTIYTRKICAFYSLYFKLLVIERLS